MRALYIQVRGRSVDLRLTSMREYICILPAMEQVNWLISAMLEAKKELLNPVITEFRYATHEEEHRKWKDDVKLKNSRSKDHDQQQD